MARAWTTAELLDDIRAQGRLPTEDTDSTDAKLLKIADGRIDTIFLPMIRKARSEWYVDEFDQTIVARQKAYRIPKRASGGAVRTVVWVDTSGVERELPPVPLTDRHMYAPSYGVPYVYTIKDNEVLPLPTPSSAIGTLRIVYERRPNTMTTTASAAYATASAAGATTQVLTASVVGASFAPGASGTLDVITADNPFSSYMQDTAFTALTVVYTMTPAGSDRFIPTNGKVWLCNIGETVIPQLPPELHPALAIVTASHYLRSVDPGASAALMDEFKAIKDDLQGLITPRQVGRQQKLKSTSSMMRRGSNSRGSFGNWRP